MEYITVEDIQQANPTLEGDEVLELILAVAIRFGDFYRYDSEHDPNIDELITYYIQDHAYIENPIGKYYSPQPIHVLKWEYIPKTEDPNDYYVGLFGFLYTNGLVVYTVTENAKPYARLWVQNDTAELFRYPQPNMEGYKQYVASIVGQDLVDEICDTIPSLRSSAE